MVVPNYIIDVIAIMQSHTNSGACHLDENYSALVVVCKRGGEDESIRPIAVGQGDTMKHKGVGNT